MATTLGAVLDQSLESQKEVLAEQFQAAKPFRHVLIRSFFSREFCERLAAEFPAFEDRYALNEMGEVGRKAVRTEVREIGPAYKELDDYIQTPEFLELISQITGIPNLLYDPDYVGGGTHENREGQSLAAHVDFNYHPRTGSHRRLNLITYLNPEWEANWGGNLDLHSNPWDAAGDEVTSIPPLFNDCVIFETNEVSWHGFSRIRLPEGRKDVSRKSFAIYLYTEERPAEDTAASHATVYVPPSIPEGVQPGEVLTEPQHQELQNNFTHHRGQLEFLYEREKEFTEQIEGLRGALNHARGETALVHRMPLQGYAVQYAAPIGVWPDSWAAEEFSFEFVPSQPVSALELDLWIPGELESTQEIEISAGGAAKRQEAQPDDSTVVELPLSAEPEETVRVTVRCSKTWSPADRGTSPDARRLAVKVLGARLRHR